MCRIMVAAGALLAWSGMLLADEPQVTVYGTATAEVVPDLMRWSLEVESKGPVPVEVAEAHLQQVQDVLALLKRSNIEQRDVQTSRMRLGENWTWKDHSRVQEGYTASTSVSFKSEDFDGYRDLWISLAAMPGVSIGGVNYDHSKRIEQQDKTRQEALLAAKRKAEAMARAVGSDIGQPLRIEEESTDDDSWRASVFSNTLQQVPTDAETPGDTLALGNIRIRIRVKASFRLITPAM